MPKLLYKRCRARRGLEDAKMRRRTDEAEIQGAIGEGDEQYNEKRKEADGEEEKKKIARNRKDK